MVGGSSKILYMGLISTSGTKIFEQLTGKIKLQQSTIDAVSNIALGFSNSLDVNLSSLSYLNYTVHFKKAINFIAIVITFKEKNDEEFVNSFFNHLLEKQFIEQFIQYADLNMPVDNTDLQSNIRKILYNLEFLTSIKELKSTKLDIQRI